MPTSGVLKKTLLDDGVYTYCCCLVDPDSGWERSYLPYLSHRRCHHHHHKCYLWEQAKIRIRNLTTFVKFICFNMNFIITHILHWRPSVDNYKNMTVCQLGNIDNHEITRSQQELSVVKLGILEFVIIIPIQYRRIVGFFTFLIFPIKLHSASKFL